MFADVIVDISAEALDRTFQYRIPPKMEGQIVPGTRVAIPFGRGNRRITGFVVGLTEQAKWPEDKIKELLSIDETDIPVEGQLLQLAAWIREQYGGTMNEALKTVLPVKKQIKSVKEHWLNFVVSQEEIKKELDRCRLRHYNAKVRLLQGMLDEGGYMTTKQAATKYQVSKSVIDSFVKAGVITVTDKTIYRNPYQESLEDDWEKSVSLIELNEEQRRVTEHFKEEYRLGRRKKYLVYGVTGSGKTEVYMEMMQEVIDEGRQVIVLIPEISLTHQTVRRFQRRFANRVSVLNSRLSEGERFDQYERAKKGEIDIIVGPRSALFAPFENLGLIVIDEEHESSYKSENPPKYHAREVAVKRAEMSGASVVLGSATPSTESYLAAVRGDYCLYEIKNRAKSAVMPVVHIVDLREEMKAGNRSVFSILLQKKIEERLKKGEQTMLFLNRRGYAGFVSCRSCGFVLKCNHCEVSMTAHKNHVGDVDTLVCHYCGHAVAMPKRCPSCGSPYIASFGLGTQKVEEMLRKRFPGARVLRMDADTTSGKYGHESVLGPFRRGEADILIGTQMIVKGHDFPNVTLVSALAADLGMYNGDYRSSERTFDLMMQAAGRAGRGKKAGEMIIQTYNPEHYSIEAVRRQEAGYFYENELAYRRMMKYPPYTCMIAILVTAQNRRESEESIRLLAEKIRALSLEDVVLIGPTEAALSKVKDRYRFVLYLKADDETKIAKIKKECESISCSFGNSVHVRYDRNPMSSY